VRRRNQDPCPPRGRPCRGGRPTHSLRPVGFDCEQESLLGRQGNDLMHFLRAAVTRPLTPARPWLRRRVAEAERQIFELVEMKAGSLRLRDACLSARDVSVYELIVEHRREDPLAELTPSEPEVLALMAEERSKTRQSHTSCGARRPPSASICARKQKGSGLGRGILQVVFGARPHQDGLWPALASYESRFKLGHWTSCGPGRNVDGRLGTPPQGAAS
jgi:hypothetical protein